MALFDDVKVVVVDQLGCSADAVQEDSKFIVTGKQIGRAHV